MKAPDKRNIFFEMLVGAAVIAVLLAIVGGGTGDIRDLPNQ